MLALSRNPTCFFQDPSLSLVLVVTVGEDVNRWDKRELLQVIIAIHNNNMP